MFVLMKRFPVNNAWVKIAYCTSPTFDEAIGECKEALLRKYAQVEGNNGELIACLPVEWANTSLADREDEYKITDIPSVAEYFA